MKFKKTLFTITLFGLLINFQAKAQNNRYQLYQVHEDRVLEGMMDKHSKGDKAIVEAAREQKMKGMNWITFVADKIDSDFPDQEVVTGYIKPELSYVEN